MTNPSIDNPAAAEPAALRVVLLADDRALHSYGPVLRRMLVGLIDEVGDLSLFCLGASRMLRYVPSPPVRLIHQTRRYQDLTARSDITSREITVLAPRIGFIEAIRPQRQAIRFAEVLSPYKPTLLHALSENQAKLAHNLSRQMKIPYVVSLLSSQNGEGSFLDERCSGILPCQSYLARCIRRDRPDMASRVQLLPIGTHVTAKPCCYERKDSRPQIFCCGNFDYGRGLPELINSARRLTDMGHKFHLTFSGRGQAEHKLRRQVSQLGLTGSVHFVPPIENMLSASDMYKAVLRTFDIFVQPWPGGTWRPELLESMSVGNAVVVADGVKNDLVIDGKTALTTPFHDEPALTKQLDKLLKNHDYARTLARQSQEHLRRHFLASRMIARLARAYRSALLHNRE